MMSGQTIGNYQGKKVKDYYQVVKEGGHEKSTGVDANVFQYLEKILPSQLKNKTILDVGCGDGRWSEYLCKLGALKVIGLDISQDMIDLATQRKVRGNLTALKLVRGDLQKIPLKDRSVDLVLSTFSLMYFKNLEKVISEISRVLKENECFFIATNIMSTQNPNLSNKLKGSAVPVKLGLGNKKIRLENLFQPLEQYKNAFQKANLTLQKEKYFAPRGVSIDSNYKYKDKVVLKKAVFKLQKK